MVFFAPKHKPSRNGIYSHPRPFFASLRLCVRQAVYACDFSEGAIGVDLMPFHERRP